MRCSGRRLASRGLLQLQAARHRRVAADRERSATRMASQVPLTPQAIEAVAAAIFDGSHAWVAETYSEFDRQPCPFYSPIQLVECSLAKTAERGGLAFFFVVYPDMGGHPELKTIYLDPRAMPAHKLRYTWEGWGLVSVQLVRAERPGATCRVSSNSEKRALKWAHTIPNLAPPSASQKRENFQTYTSANGISRSKLKPSALVAQWRWNVADMFLGSQRAPAHLQA